MECIGAAGVLMWHTRLMVVSESGRVTGRLALLKESQAYPEDLGKAIISAWLAGAEQDAGSPGPWAPERNPPKRRRMSGKRAPPRSSGGSDSDPWADVLQLGASENIGV